MTVSNLSPEQPAQPADRGLRGTALSVLVVSGFLLLVPFWWAYWTVSAVGVAVVGRRRSRATRPAALTAVPGPAASAQPATQPVLARTA